MEQEEELESLSYLYSEDELIILSNASVVKSPLGKSPVHLQVRVQSSPENEISPIKSLLDLEWGASLITIRDFIT